jgi:hypothetical protein
VGELDNEVTHAVAAGLDPILCLYDMPPWGRDQTQEPIARPSSYWFGKLAEGIARRYSGSFNGLPRVRYWQAWNEPNLGPNLEPERLPDNTLVAPDWYRRMVNAFSSGVKGVHTDNLVIAGGLAPYAATTGDGIAPLTFMQQFLCLTTAQIRPRPHCVDRVNFDIWATQPYTWGGPTHQSGVPGDVMLGDLPSMKAALDQAIAEQKIISNQPTVQFWVTEFSWDTNPPDPGAVEIHLQARWTSQALYVMWQNGVSLVTWFLIRDQPLPGSRWQSGLYFRGNTIASDTRKLTFEAFRFPMVAFVEVGGIRVWCRTPSSIPGSVIFEWNPNSDGSGPWTTLDSVTTDSNGITDELIPTGISQGLVRARLVSSGEVSVPFSLEDVPDMPVDPFGN